jgi:hypothetical protein
VSEGGEGWTGLSLSSSTGRNVSAVFEKLGYDPEVGVEIFNSVCEGLARRKGTEGRDRARSGAETDPDSELAAIAEAPSVSGGGGEGPPSDGSDDRIDRRMDLDNFITAAVEVDDSLIQAIQLVSRKRLFRMLKQQAGGRIASNQSSSSEQQQEEKEGKEGAVGVTEV